MTSSSLFQDFTTSNKYTLSCLQDLISGKRIIDILFFPPADYKSVEILESTIDFTKSILEKTDVILEVSIVSHQPSFKITPKTPYKIFAETESGQEILLVFFAGNAGMWKSTFKENQKYSLLCKLQKMGKILSTSHPKILNNTPKIKQDGGGIFPRYPLSGALTQNFITNFVAKHLPLFENFQEDWHLDGKFLPLNQAIKLLHTPKTQEDVTKAKLRLAYDELFAKHLAYFIANFKLGEVQSDAINLNQHFLSEVLEVLPFELTEDQEIALKTLLTLQAKDTQNTALLQGDVGSGKTVIALLLALNVVKSGLQVAIMSPTFILASQTFASFSEICSKLNVEIIFFSGEDKGKRRHEKLQKIKTGEAKIIIGTHALFSADVEFAKLGYIVIDEQHRFGTNQRLQLTSKAQGVKTLLMTATPIPRTLSMALYGEIEVIYIKNKPKNRKEIVTKLFSQDKIPDIIEAVKRKMEANELIYWVVPLIEEGEEGKEVRGTSIEKRFSELKGCIDENLISVVHGKMKEKEIFAEMEKFQAGKTKIMLATTVIEVGVNVPSATLMVIESAENFGLSALHQLRGRVGRGDLQSYCFLISSSKSENIVNRLKIITNSNDGFFVAEKDMEIRGSGAIFSKMQSGFEGFKFADFNEHKEIFRIAKVDAKKFFESDPNLESEIGLKLRNLLKIYNYNILIDYFKI